MRAIERAADLLWTALSDGPLPHDRRKQPFGPCPQCGTWTDTKPCTVDWRKPLHRARYIGAAEALDAAGLLTSDQAVAR